MRTVDEFQLALRTLRSAAQFVCPRNYSYLALENYFHSKKFMEDMLRHDENQARTLCQFTDFVLSKNSRRRRDGSRFILFGDLIGFWDAFVGARGHTEAPSFAQPHAAGKHLTQNKKDQKDRKRK